jgi:hypothetical protein
VIDGGAGIDTYDLSGTTAAATVTLGGVAPQATSADTGADTVNTSVTYTLALGSEVEILNGTNAAGQTLTVNAQMKVGGVEDLAIEQSAGEEHLEIALDRQGGVLT